MPEVATELKTFRFDQMAVQVKDKVHPDDADVDRYVGLEHIDPESLKIRRWGEPGDVESTKILFRAGDIIFGKRRAYQRKLAVADFDGICSAHAMVLRPKTDVVLKEFLPFFMQTDTFMERAVKISVGGLSPTINWRDLAKEEFALPPIEEQRRLVRVLCAVKLAIERLEQAEAEADCVIRSMLCDVFDPDLKALHHLPRLETLCERIGDGTHLPPPFTDSGVPFLLVSNLSGGYLDWEVEKFVSADSYAELTKSFRPGPRDILYTLVGSYGVPVIVDTDRDFTFQRHIGFIRVKSSMLTPEYLYWYLRSPAGKLQADWRAEGLAQLTITLKALRDFRIPLCDISEQVALTERFAMVDAQRMALAARRACLIRLQRTILNGEICGVVV